MNLKFWGRSATRRRAPKKSPLKRGVDRLDQIMSFVQAHRIEKFDAKQAIDELRAEVVRSEKSLDQRASRMTVASEQMAGVATTMASAAENMRQAMESMNTAAGQLREATAAIVRENRDLSRLKNAESVLESRIGALIHDHGQFADNAINEIKKATAELISAKHSIDECATEHIVHGVCREKRM